MELSEIIEILKDLHPEVDFDTCTTLIDDKILNSFDIISVIAEISDRFDISIPAGEIVAENFNSAQALFSLVSRLSDDD
ncbi:MAG: acyl carrier protein [Oscillospiraceae bacterium]|jgi:acyl carrier protein|nr:acyl carrier protein [Oscillospiraceae bacterium]